MKSRTNEDNLDERTDELGKYLKDLIYIFVRRSILIWVEVIAKTNFWTELFGFVTVITYTFLLRVSSIDHIPEYEYPRTCDKYFQPKILDQ